ncbi:DegV family protein [Clostridium tunisiense]|uniref:DegV family protein n=1 Tax=Clostridium tunisiense TaxID=219748 RepID=UPI0002EFA8C9|nr:DegV family protein [Clostridium tunisiense]
MNRNIVLVVDSASALPLEFIEQENIIGAPIICHFKGKDVEDDFGKTLNIKEFYEGLRAGEMPTTSQINVFRFEEIFRPLAEENKSVIYIGLSSGLTGTVDSAKRAVLNIKEEFPQADINVIDSLCASLGLGLLCYLAYEKIKEGKSKEEIISFVENTKMKVNHYFTVDDLNHLKRGGRISSSAAAVGTLLNVKPVLHMDKQGKLAPLMKVRGRKKAIATLAEKFIERTDKKEMQTISIVHGDCLEDALHLEQLCRENGNVEKCLINFEGPTVASHTGAGLVSLYFIAKERE